MPERFEATPQESVQNAHSRLNLVELAGLDNASKENSPMLVSGVTANEAGRSFDCMKLAENAVFAGIAGARTEVAAALQRHVFGVSQLVKHEVPLYYHVSAPSHITVPDLAKVEATVTRNAALRGIGKGLATVGLVWGAERIIDSQLYKDEPIRAGTMVADMIASPAIAFLPTNWALKGAAMVAVHTLGKQLDQKYGQ